MSMTNINIRVDTDIKQQAQEMFGALGLDMSTAINIFLRQVIQYRGIPFPVVERRKESRTPHRGGWEGKIWMADDFDEPLDDFKEYMG